VLDFPRKMVLEEKKINKPSAADGQGEEGRSVITRWIQKKRVSLRSHPARGGEEREEELSIHRPKDGKKRVQACREGRIWRALENRIGKGKKEENRRKIPRPPRLKRGKKGYRTDKRKGLCFIRKTVLKKEKGTKRASNLTMFARGKRGPVTDRHGKRERCTVLLSLHRKRNAGKGERKREKPNPAPEVGGKKKEPITTLPSLPQEI